MINKQTLIIMANKKHTYINLLNMLDIHIVWKLDEQKNHVNINIPEKKLNDRIQNRIGIWI